MMKSPYLVFFSFFQLFNVIFVQSIYSQKDTIRYNIGLQTVFSNGKAAPFWIQNGQFGTVAYDRNSVSAYFQLSKQFQHPNRIFDYSYGIYGSIGSLNSNTNLNLYEFYFKSRLWLLNFSAGSYIHQNGNQDESLSSGGFLFSNNAPPIPKIFFGIENFTPVFFKNGIFEIKGGIAHGWFLDDVYVKNILLHHKHAYFRIGGNRALRFQFGVDHVAQWGGNIPGYGQQPVGFKNFLNILLLQSGSNSNVEFEKVNMGGNHLIAQNMRIDLRLGKTEFGAYWQLVNEDKPIRLMWNSVNVHDGLWGFSIKNKEFTYLKGFLYEYLNTTDQNGPYHDKDGIVYGGSDNYFNNYLYITGWTHFGRTIGTPFITSTIYNESDAIYLKNTRVQVHHLGLEGEVCGYNYKVLNSYSKNYGSYSEPINKNAVSLLIEVNKNIEKLWGLNFGISVGADWGSMYGDNLGVMIKLSKNADLFKY